LNKSINLTNTTNIYKTVNPTSTMITY